MKRNYQIKRKYKNRLVSDIIIADGCKNENKIIQLKKKDICYIAVLAMTMTDGCEIKTMRTK